MASCSQVCKQVGIKGSTGDEAVFRDMKLLLALSVCYGLIFHFTHSGKNLIDKCASFASIWVAVMPQRADPLPCETCMLCYHRAIDSFALLPTTKN